MDLRLALDEHDDALERHIEQVHGLDALEPLVHERRGID